MYDEVVGYKKAKRERLCAIFRFQFPVVGEGCTGMKGAKATTLLVLFFLQYRSPRSKYAFDASSFSTSSSVRETWLRDQSRTHEHTPGILEGQEEEERDEKICRPLDLLLGRFSFVTSIAKSTHTHNRGR